MACQVGDMSDQCWGFLRHGFFILAVHCLMLGLVIFPVLSFERYFIFEALKGPAGRQLCASCSLSVLLHCFDTRQSAIRLSVSQCYLCICRSLPFISQCYKVICSCVDISHLHVIKLFFMRQSLYSISRFHNFICLYVGLFPLHVTMLFVYLSVPPLHLLVSQSYFFIIQTHPSISQSQSLFVHPSISAPLIRLCIYLYLCLLENVRVLKIDVIIISLLSPCVSKLVVSCSHVGQTTDHLLVSQIC